ncbi:DUF5107 domain-containing protein [Tessaracoccus antarcticus]|uniref:DUF5107 domain-containing protein n=1 Tax=Tessaracoccus antarcticus TaxID=2479848 RepID=UPI001F43C70F|nr:DUF5107 domain-containing protein [Tessaracoccus antarcticus]
MVIRHVEVTIPTATLGPEGLPVLQVQQPPDLSAADRILLGEQPGRPLAARPASALPYRHQNHYGRDVAPQTLPAIELSNSHLRAVFLPGLGGRLWSLEEVASGRQLLFQPDAIQFGNLALRDAWFAGGVEWNLGMTGHWGLTCTPVGAGVVDVDGQQVLRMWAWERLTRMVWRMDAFLPEDSPFLFTSPRITNHGDDAVPFYWWSNAAVAMRADSRVLAPATSAVFNNYAGTLERVAFPDDPDRSRPAHAPQAVDYFFDTVSEQGLAHPSPWVAGCDEDGTGTLLASSSDMRGKKLFVWGNTRGGGKWQDWLNGTGRYFELQSGWARTQKEHIALAPGHTATWVEAFGSVEADPAADFDAAVAQVADQVPTDGMARAGDLFERAAALQPTIWHQADGWGRVETEAGFLQDDPSAPFGDAPLDESQRAWLGVARGSALDSALERSPQTGAPWAAAVSRTPPGAHRELHLGYLAWAGGRREEAEQHWRRALAEDPHNSMALHALATCSEDGWDSFDFAERAHEADPRDDDLLVDYLQRSHTVPTLVLSVVERLSPQRRALPRVRVAEARALVTQGHLAEARDMMADLVLPNLREVSTELADLWAEYSTASGTSDPLPEHLDFAMH